MVEKIITANYLEIESGDIYPGEIVIEDGYFKEVIPIACDDEEILDLDYDGILIPGFIDSHIHIESSKLVPSYFAEAVLPRGTTSVIADSHEIANVLGMDGINFMVDNAKDVPFDFYFAAPSCVPATDFETTGAVINCEDIGELLGRDEFVALGEMMNFPGVLSGDEEVISKIHIAHEKSKPVDGHAPLLSGADLDNYVSYGILTDHECSTLDEAIEKTLKGVKIMVREGSSAKDMAPLLNENARLNFWIELEKAGVYVGGSLDELLSKAPFDFLVSDDISSKDLLHGHLDKLLKQAISYGLAPNEAIKMVTYNPAKHYNLNSGEIAPDKIANFLLVDNFEDFNIKKVWVHGELVAEDGNSLIEVPDFDLINNFKLNPVDSKDFDVNIEMEYTNSLMDEYTTAEVMVATDGMLITDRISADLLIKNKTVLPDVNKDILKIAVLDRYGKSNITNGFIKGFGIKKGAIASSVAHDSHNVIVIGTNSEDMAKAVNLIVDKKGGLSVVSDDFEEVLELPVAGLMSDKDVNYVADKLKLLGKLTSDLGCELNSPFTTLSFMALLVIPNLKISDQGLFDLNEFSFVDLIPN